MKRNALLFAGALAAAPGVATRVYAHDLWRHDTKPLRDPSGSQVANLQTVPWQSWSMPIEVGVWLGMVLCTLLCVVLVVAALARRRCHSLGSPVAGPLARNPWINGRRAAALGLLMLLEIVRATHAGQKEPLPDALRHIAASFAPFQAHVTTHTDGRYFYVNSDGLPDHPMMVGITAWQQQVPLPQDYRGSNAWRFPLNPTPAAQPLSAKDHFFRGAIAIAANGIPIFNPIKNDGRTDTLLAGELDEYGGHCGRGDDYHYHVAPLHLQKTLGTQLPLAYALDGYPIYGLTEPDGIAATDLDAMNGHTSAQGYHYHATKSYPYLNGGFHGQVEEVDGQVHPQPVASSPRPPTRPLRGARITSFQRNGPEDFTVIYEANGRQGKVRYRIQPGASVIFDYTYLDGRSESITYAARRTRTAAPRAASETGDNPAAPAAPTGSAAPAGFGPAAR